MTPQEFGRFNSWRSKMARQSDDARDLFRRLVWSHGEARALDILTGVDKRTNADLEAWRDLGRAKGRNPPP